MMQRYLQDGDVVVITRPDKAYDGEYKHVIIESRRMSGIYDFSPSAADNHYSYCYRVDKPYQYKMARAEYDYIQSVDQILARNGWSTTEISQGCTYDLRTILAQIKMANTVIELSNDYLSGKASYWDICPFIPQTPGGWKESELPILINKSHAVIKKLSPFVQHTYYPHVVGFKVEAFGVFSKRKAHVHLNEVASHHHHDTPVEYHANDVVMRLIDKVGGKTNLRREMLKLAETSRADIAEQIGVITAEFDESFATKRLLVKITPRSIGPMTMYV